jgi:excisionase family DNA binding protein
MAASRFRQVGRTRHLLHVVPRAIPEGFISVQQAAEQTGLRRETFFRWIKDGRLKRYRVGGIRDTLLKREELERELGPREG